MCLFRVATLAQKKVGRKLFVNVDFGCGRSPLKEHIRIIGIGLELAWKRGLCGKYH